MKIPYRRVNRDATELFRSGEGYNLYAMEVEQCRDICLVHTGFALDIPEGYMGFVFTHPSNLRSGVLVYDDVRPISGKAGEELIVRVTNLHDAPPDYLRYYLFTHPVARLYIFPMQSVELELQQ